jgi:hypothetical protein
MKMFMARRRQIRKGKAVDFFAERPTKSQVSRINSLIFVAHSVALVLFNLFFWKRIR